MAGLRGRAERSSPEAAQRRAEGAGLEAESAHRAIILFAAMRALLDAVLNERVLVLESQFATVSSSGVSVRERLERRLL